jgi:septal ring factor EnvC (AmiA/AmiB activator)
MSERGRPDPLDGLVAARDAVRKLQELAGKVVLPPEHRAALTEGLAKLVMPGEQIQALIDLAEAFGPPQTQIEEIRKTIATQRDQLEKMLDDLQRVEAGVDRLAAAAEQLAAAQRPFMQALSFLGAADPTAQPKAPDHEEADGEPDT